MPKQNLQFKVLLLSIITHVAPLLLFVVIWGFFTRTNLGETLIFGSFLFGVNIITFAAFYFYFKSRIFTPLKELWTVIKQSLIPQAHQGEIVQGNEILAATSYIRNYLKNEDSRSKYFNKAIEAEDNKTLLAVSQIADGVIGIDFNSNITLFNKGAENITGVLLKDVIKQPLSSVLKFYQRNKELPIQTYAPLKKDFEGVIYSADELKIVNMSGKESYSNITVTQPLEGKLINLACFITLHDATKEKQLEAMKLDFVSMAAHELRTPLTSIKGYLSVFIQENEHTFTEDQMMFVRRINTSAQQLSALVENLLSVSRVERGAMSLTVALMDWVANVTQSVEMFENRANEKRIAIHFIKPTTEIPHVKADNVRINEVLNNLISNAINYTEPGGKIEVSIETKEDEVITHVKDSGHGISADALQHLFTKFYRAPGNADQASKGNGLGLYLSKSIVELHHGRIWAESEGLGKGTTFSFSLPSEKSSKIDITVLTKKL